MRAVDTNVLVRFTTRDNARQVAAEGFVATPRAPAGGCSL